MQKSAYAASLAYSRYLLAQYRVILLAALLTTSAMRRCDYT
ncbi:MAG TPA: hypothetical protein VIG95_01920 [Gemmatimonadales bacterium]